MQVINIDDRPAERWALGRRMRWDRELSRQLVARLWRDPHGLLSEGKPLQTKPRATVVRLEDHGQPLVFKYLNWGGLRRTIVRSLQPSTAQRNWTDGRTLQAAGIPTPRPRAVHNRGVGPLGWCSYLLTDFVPGTTLYRFMRFEDPSHDVVSDLAEQVAHICARLCDLRVSHNDFKPENLLVDPEGQVWLIDLEHMRRHKDAGEALRRNVRGLRDLFHPRNWRTRPEAADVFRQALLRELGPVSVEGCEFPLDAPLPETNREAELLSVVIPCYNAAGTLAACLDSIQDIADELIVADAGSKDATRNIAEDHGCRVAARISPLDAQFENWADDQARHPWILRLRPDERVDPELRRQIQDRLAASSEADGYLLSRAADFRLPTAQRGNSKASVRLYRQGAGSYRDAGHEVELAMTSGRVQELTSHALYEIADQPQPVGHESRPAAQASQQAYRKVA